MSTQEIQDYKLNWLMTQSFRVVLKDVEGPACIKWINANLDEKVWEYSIDPEDGQYTFQFEKAADAAALQEQFTNDDRTVDLG